VLPTAPRTPDATPAVPETTPEARPLTPLTTSEATPEAMLPTLPAVEPAKSARLDPPLWRLPLPLDFLDDL
jgi:hypothetical protein